MSSLKQPEGRSVEERIAKLSRQNPSVNGVATYVANFEASKGVGPTLKGIKRWGEQGLNLLLDAEIMEIVDHTQGDIEGVLEIVRFVGGVPNSLKCL